MSASAQLHSRCHILQPRSVLLLNISEKVDGVLLHPSLRLFLREGMSCSYRRRRMVAAEDDEAAFGETSNSY